ncbi:hydrogenase-1 operon protein HyaE [Hydrogenivirga caldilitoris]|uniref:Hydrogenase-1 operon protein HyaE n=1 Tax=Hydrogenivirga caldilitoris TaxID=246264 RepID=A0A497XPG8_9AQUI|nr:hypothetical protein [Hydrogenivirga caldilitoris]RLJ70778.1 hydrogenase-1 operon protein HyaE [Hydrogenivirga caldilitoris]
MRLEELKRLSADELGKLITEKRNFVLYVRSEKDREKIKEIFDVDVVFPELARSFPDLEFYVVDIGDAKELLKELGVLFAPVVLVIREGKPVKKLEGIKSWAEYTSAVGELLC